jgi:hypothetical protein
MALAIIEHTKLLNSIKKPACVLTPEGVLIIENQEMFISGDRDLFLSEITSLIENPEHIDDNILLSEIVFNECRYFLAIVLSYVVNSRLIELEMAAKTDGLTGLYNKTEFISVLGSRLDFAKKNWYKFYSNDCRLRWI